MSSNKYKIGFTLGTFDLFHVGHLHHIIDCKNKCDILIVGVQTDELCYSYKDKYPIFCAEHRLEIINCCRYVDFGVIVNTFNFIDLYQELNFDVIFVGNDWIGSKVWEDHKKEMNPLGVDIIFTSSGRIMSSTEIRQRCYNSIINPKEKARRRCDE